MNRFFGIYYLQNVFLVITSVSLSLILFKFIFDFRYLNLNFIILQGLVLLILITISRVFIQRLYFHKSENGQNKYNTLIFGAGSEGINLYRRLKINSDYNFIAFIDEDINKIGRFADDLQVYSISGIQYLKKKINISKCFVCVPSASSLKLREIGQILNYNNIEVVELNKNKIENYNLPIEIKRSNILKRLNQCSKFY